MPAVGSLIVNAEDSPPARNAGPPAAALATAFLPYAILAYHKADRGLQTALFALGVVYLPAALHIAASSSSFLAILAVVPALLIIIRVPLTYFTMVGFLIPVLLFGALVNAITPDLQADLSGIPLFPRLLTSAMAMYAPFVAARMLGLLVREHSADS
jgi:hypothetical protein